MIMDDMILYLAIAFPIGLLIGWLAYKIQKCFWVKPTSKFDDINKQLEQSMAELKNSTAKLERQVESMKVYTYDYMALNTMLDDLDIPIQD